LPRPSKYHFPNVVDAINFRMGMFKNANDIARLEWGQKGVVIPIALSLFQHTHVVMMAIDTKIMMPGIMPRVSKTKGIDKTPSPI
jgi:hypothetical protein